MITSWVRRGKIEATAKNATLIQKSLKRYLHFRISPTTTDSQSARVGLGVRTLRTEECYTITLYTKVLTLGNENKFRFILHFAHLFGL